ncbi:hypothetical protein ACJJJB_00220 (plasmid) [Microbulbifer sp. ANSA001]|uniref:hypothetical protein n=1 Tax=Microbulbifer sp. ANSA001 TaxID=3243358 RepID=UPI0040415942
MRKAQCKRAELAYLCNTSERQITRYRSGYPIPQHRIDLICERCGISEHYLLYGKSAAGAVEIYSPSEPECELSLPSINQEPVHPLHIGLLRHIRCCSTELQISMLDRVINNRWSVLRAPFEGGNLLLDGIPLDRYEVAAVLALRAIDDVGQEIALINQLVGTRL